LGVNMTGQGSVEIDGRRVAYEWLEVDVRTEEQRRADADAGRLGGDPAVVIPGHGQTIASPRKLTAAAAALGGAGIAWCIDITPAAGGDPVKARALSLIVRDRIAALFPAAPPVQATLLGWSHGGGEALRSAECDPDLFPRVAGLCPAGLIERRPGELLRSFLGEVAHIVWGALLRRNRTGLRDGLRVGCDILRGMGRDLIRSRSLRRVVDDIRWASRVVPGPRFGYNGDVALLFGRNDTVIRWQAVFPGCAAPGEIPAQLNAYRRRDFPAAARLGVSVLEGDHLSPESAAEEFVRAAYALLGVRTDERRSQSR
jgi:hypothetical protein